MLEVNFAQADISQIHRRHRQSHVWRREVTEESQQHHCGNSLARLSKSEIRKLIIDCQTKVFLNRLMYIFDR